jgi:hypothetical protein
LLEISKKIMFFTGQQSQSDEPNESVEDKLLEQHKFPRKIEIHVQLAVI